MTQTAVIFCETSNPTKQVIDEPPMVRITGQYCPDRGTIRRSRANRDYRMSTYDNAYSATSVSRQKQTFTAVTEILSELRTATAYFCPLN
jgi:hypothetical protein